MDYREKATSGKSWRRAHQVVLRNGLGTVPTFTFHEEDIVQVGDLVHAVPSTDAPLRGSFDAAGEVRIINPWTGEDTGQVASHAQVYAILHSLYRELAAKRDAQEGEA